jgi:membrane-bound lytic murein transglycosylase B
LSCNGAGPPGPPDAPSRGLRTPTATHSGPHAASATPAPSSPEVLPAVPSRRPTAFARELGRVVATLRDRRSTPAQVRRAGEYHQLAVRRLVSASSVYRRAVLARLGRGTKVMISGDVRAASSLVVLTAPQDRLPRWRITAPPPMDELRGYYAEAQRLTGVHWTYLAAINLVETRMGRIRGTSAAGAQGPMQFLPSTWQRYGGDGDINDPRDAILAAARLLKANGAPADMSSALFRYNPSDHYVRAITEHARTMQRTPYVYRGYWHWRVLFRHVRGVYVLPEGYPAVRPVLLERR